MPALRDNLEAEPLLTGNGGGQQAGDGDQLGEKRQMAPVINSDFNLTLDFSIFGFVCVLFILQNVYKQSQKKSREMLSSALMHFGRSQIYGECSQIEGILFSITVVSIA